MRIIANPFLVDVSYVQNRTNKNRRINKKWAKRYGFTRVETPMNSVINVMGTLYAHPDVIAAIEAQIGGMKSADD